MKFPVGDINASVIKLVRDTVRKYTSSGKPRLLIKYALDWDWL